MNTAIATASVPGLVIRRALLSAAALVCAVSSAFSQVVINELHYDPALKTEPVEFIELYNTGPNTIDLSGWRFSAGVDFTFPAGSVIASNGYAVVAENPVALSNKFGVRAYGPWSGKLGNDGETVTLRDASSNIVDTLTYASGVPWPTAARGDGSSMELVNPSLPRILPGSWRSSGYPVSELEAPATPMGDFFAATSMWRYRKGLSEPSTPRLAWRMRTFVEDGTWLSGRACIGFGRSYTNTPLTDMRNHYSTIYLRKFFTVGNPSNYSALLLECQYDDGIIVWINGTNVVAGNVASSETPCNGTALAGGDDDTFRPFDLTGYLGCLVPGTNIIAIQVLNSAVSNSDAFIDARLSGTLVPIPRSPPTPGARNSVYATNTPPLVWDVVHSPQQPGTGVPVCITARVIDSDGVSNVVLKYQAVSPGAYLRLTDPAYATTWTSVAMHDDGLNGDAIAGDSVYTVVLPPSLQTHRRLVRYRIEALAAAGLRVRLPYSDDPVPNFACFCYSAIPAWQGALMPGSTPVLTFGTNTMRALPPFHLIADAGDVYTCQFVNISDYENTYYHGTLVYDGIVYDHLDYRIKGTGSTYVNGKNKWKFNFTPTHRLRMLDDYGVPFNQKWDKVNLGTGVLWWWDHDHGTDGIILNEPLVYRFYELAGVPACHTTFIQLRVIDDATEANAANQYDGDFWGLYIAIEDPDGQYLDERGMDDGNMYNMAGSVADSTQKNQGATQVSDKTDLDWFTSASTGYPRTSPSIQPLAWWRSNINLDVYYSYNAVTWGVNNSDQREMWNSIYYHSPSNGAWWMLPWDVELSFCSTSHWYEENGSLEEWRYSLLNPGPALEFTNRVRELSDLLFNGEQASALIDEYAARVTRGSPAGLTFAEANQAVWDYHPQINMPGYFYANMLNFGQTISPRDFPTMVQYLKTYLGPSGYGGRALARRVLDPAIPNTPAIAYVGTPGYPADDLRFQCSAFSDPQGTTTFAAIQWRIGEVTDTTSPVFNPFAPRKYEVETVWSSGALAVFSNRATIPASAVQPGHTYRARIRMKDTSGRWSHWSAPVQFVPGATAAAQYLRVSELMYHPPGNELSEFVELYNTAPFPLVVSNIVFTDGIDFVFSTDSTVAFIGPTSYVVLVQDIPTFASRYDTNGIVIAGQYRLSLANAGEAVRIQRADGVHVHSFAYSDQWYPLTDGGGYSLVINDAYGATSLWNVAIGWHASQAVGGTPGTPDVPEPWAACAATVLLSVISRRRRLET